MSIEHHIPVRSARNRLIDLLGMGAPYPLSDLNVVADHLRVAFGSTAKVPIECAQAGVRYELCGPQGETVSKGLVGADATLTLETPAVSEDITYRVRATTVSSPQLQRFLDEGASVKVGIDTALRVEILDAPLLQPTLENPNSSAPRLVSYHASVTVRVYGSQEGVDYRLVIDGKDSGVSKQGSLGGIDFTTAPMTEDVLIQVRASKVFTDQALEPQSALLDARLYLKVKANPALAVVVVVPVVTHGMAATMKIAATQASVKYRAYRKPIADEDFIRGTVAPAEVITVPVFGRPAAQIRRPQLWNQGEVPSGFASGALPLAGNGQELAIALNDIRDDSVCIVRATKEHIVDADNPAAGAITSAVLLHQPAAVLVSADVNRALRLRLPMLPGKSGSSLQVHNGEPGVFYYFRPLPTGVEWGAPAYFHKRDAVDPTQNKGVGQLAIEVDCVVAADVLAPTSTGDRAAAYPVPPQLDFEPVSPDTRLAVRTVKAQTGAMVYFSPARQPLLAAVPQVTAAAAMIDYGSVATILISPSNPADRYQLTLHGQPVGAAATGNREQLVLQSNPLTQDSTLEVVITRVNESTVVERVVAIAVAVRPPVLSE